MLLVHPGTPTGTRPHYPHPARAFVGSLGYRNPPVAVGNSARVLYPARASGLAKSRREASGGGVSYIPPSTRKALAGESQLPLTGPGRAWDFPEYAPAGHSRADPDRRLGLHRRLKRDSDEALDVLGALTSEHRGKRPLRRHWRGWTSGIAAFRPPDPPGLATLDRGGGKGMHRGLAKPADSLRTVATRADADAGSSQTKTRSCRRRGSPARRTADEARHVRPMSRFPRCGSPALSPSLVRPSVRPAAPSRNSTRHALRACSVRQHD